MGTENMSNRITIIIFFIVLSDNSLLILLSLLLTFVTDYSIFDISP